MKQFSVVIIGAGNRGGRYARIMADHKDKFKVVAVADPRQTDREYVQSLHGFGDEGCFNSWQELLAQPKMADIAVIATVDSMHTAPALKAIELGYNLLIEKPVAQTPEECVQIAEAARKKGVKVLVCHVLRYTNFYGTIKQLLMDGTIGEVVSADLAEAIGHTHFAHSYVRGNWHKEKETTPMLLAKSCHDLDIVQWLLDKPCQRVHSFGSLVHFRAENAPEGAPERCDDVCPVYNSCPYNCHRFYLKLNLNTKSQWPSVITAGMRKEHTPTPKEIMKALEVKDYGRCVYHMDNDVVDHQVVSMEFQGGTTATLTVNAFNFGGRYIRLYGTNGELFAHMKDEEIQVFSFDKGHYTVPVKKVDEHITGGHGGGDDGIIEEMHEYFSDNYTGFRAADIQVSVRNHMIGFAAEQARHNGTVVSVEEYMKEKGLTI